MKWGKKVALRKLRVKQGLHSLTATDELRLVKLEEIEKKEKIEQSLVSEHWDIKELKNLRNGED